MVLRVCCHELHDWGGSGRRMGEVEGEGERRARLKMSCVSFFLSFFLSLVDVLLIQIRFVLLFLICINIILSFHFSSRRGLIEYHLYYVRLCVFTDICI